MFELKNAFDNKIINSDLFIKTGEYRNEVVSYLDEANLGRKYYLNWVKNTSMNFDDSESN